MKIDRLEAHDRLLHLKKQDHDIGKTCQEMINLKPFGDHPFYIFAHKRQLGLDERLALYREDFNRSLLDPYYVRLYTSLDQVPTDRLIWQPRLTKPKAQTNSMLFKGYPGTDNVKVIWIIPDRCLWDQFEKGKMTENKTVWESIQAFVKNKEILESKEPDDYSDEAIEKIYFEITRAAKRGGAAPTI
jgi:hypothetical protein